MYVVLYVSVIYFNSMESFYFVHHNYHFRPFACNLKGRILLSFVHLCTETAANCQLLASCLFFSRSRCLGFCSLVCLSDNFLVCVSVYFIVFVSVFFSCAIISRQTFVFRWEIPAGSQQVQWAQHAVEYFLYRVTTSLGGVRVQHICIYDALVTSDWGNSRSSDLFLCNFSFLRFCIWVHITEVYTFYGYIARFV